MICPLKPCHRPYHRLRPRQRDNAGEFEREAAHLVPRDHHLTTAERSECIDRCCHRSIVGSNHNDIMAVMRDGGAKSALLQPEAADKAQRITALARISFDHRDLQEIPRRVRLEHAVPYSHFNDL